MSDPVPAKSSPKSIPPVTGNLTKLELQHPLVAFTILAPLALLGEVLRRTSDAPSQLLADPLLVQLGRLAGLDHLWVPLIALTVWWLLVQIGARHPWKRPALSVLALTVAWGFCWAVARIAVGCAFHYGTADSIAGRAGLLISGAVQEELLFRGIILGLAVAVVKLYDWPDWILYGICLPLSAVFFSLAHTTLVNHHPGAEFFAMGRCLERSIAGMIYGYAFLRQGLAVSTLAHLGHLCAVEALPRLLL